MRRLAATAFAAVVFATAISGCGEKDEPPVTPSTATIPTTPTATAPAPTPTP